MLQTGQNWGKTANCPPQCSTKIGTPASFSETIEHYLLRCNFYNSVKKRCTDPRQRRMQVI